MEKGRKKTINPYFKMAEVIEEIIKDVIIEDIEKEEEDRQYLKYLERNFVLF